MKQLFLVILSMLTITTYSQRSCQLPEIVPTAIKGAPTLSKPFIMMAGDELAFVEKFGMAHPSVFDWNGDGKNDILIGEFGGGHKSNVKIFLNTGTNENPKFAKEFLYAKDSSGKLLSVDGL